MKIVEDEEVHMKTINLTRKDLETLLHVSNAYCELMEMEKPGYIKSHLELMTTILHLEQRFEEALSSLNSEL